ILRHVRSLPAAHAMLVGPAGQVRVWRYWDLDAARCAALSAGLSFDEQAQRVRGLLSEAARTQMVSDVPLGAFLSGGVDSSAIVAAMMHVTGRPVHTYSVGFAGAGRGIDETEDSGRTAVRLGSVHQQVEVRGNDVRDALPDIAGRLGQPTVDGVNMYFV